MQYKIEHPENVPLKQIANYPTYGVTTWGAVYNLKTMKRAKELKKTYEVILVVNGNRIKETIADLVNATFSREEIEAPIRNIVNE